LASLKKPTGYRIITAPGEDWRKPGRAAYGVIAAFEFCTSRESDPKGQGSAKGCAYANLLVTAGRRHREQMVNAILDHTEKVDFDLTVYSAGLASTV
jgi:hypothetical protein